MGMMVAHVGVGVFIVGVTVVKSSEIERDVKLQPGQSVQVRDLQFTLRELREREGPNFQAVQGVVEVSRDGQLVARMLPEKRIYRVQRMPMTEAAIRSRPWGDLYVSLGEPVDQGAAWVVRVYVKPFVTWIWGGCALMALGGALAATDRRYRARKTATTTLPAHMAGASPAGGVR
jgi:cytochrome c-type biogenesis protein CcmF